MQKSYDNTALGSVLRLLYQPLPFFPELTFIESARSEQRKKQALARIREKAPQERKLRGNIELLGKGSCRICGHLVEINEATWVFGDIRNGAVAEMILTEIDSKFVAKRVVII